MQKNIESFFASTSNDGNYGSSESSSDDSEDPPQSHSNIKEFEKMLRKGEKVKTHCSIVLSELKSGCSIVWSYFGSLTLRGKVVLPKTRFCKLCFEMESTTLKGFSVGTSTSNHITHLRSVHNKQIKTKNEDTKLKATNKALSGSSSNSYRTKEEAKFINARRIAEMCCTDLQAFNIVERQGFKKYVSQIKPDLEMPRGRTIATTALQDVYSVYFKIVKQELEKAPKNVSLVLDLWTDNYKRLSYVNIKLHYCVNFKMNSVSLKTEYFPHPHTGSRIAEKVTLTLKEFNLDQRTIHAVSDGGSNIVSAMKLSNIVRYECMAHALHRFLVHDVLNNEMFSSTLAVVKKLKIVFKKLTYATEDLVSIQKTCHQDELMTILCETSEISESLDLEDEYGISVPNDMDAHLLDALHKKEPTSLKNSNDTRWNTLLSMFRSFSKNFNSINIALIKAGRDTFVFQEMEKKIIQEFTDFLSIFEKATVYLQGRNYPTICSVIVFYENIISSFKQHEDKAEFESTIALFEFAINNFKTRFKIKAIHVIAALMDPCQRNWPVLQKWIKKMPKNADILLNQVLENDYSEFSCTTKHELIYNQVLLLDSPRKTQSSHNSSGEPQPIKKPKISATRKDMLQFLASTSNEATSEDNLHKEIQAYFDAPHEDTECLEWWQQKREIFPRIAKLAEFCFGIPATSASSEEAFSVAGACITAKRSRLNPCTAKRQLFVHDNQPLVEPILKSQ